MGTPAQITVRSTGPNYDPLYGNGQNCFLIGLDAVAQIIGTRLRLFQGEWWENTLAGTPIFQSILERGGASSTGAIGAILQGVIYGSPFVKQVRNLSVTYNSDSRALKFSCSVVTAFGTVNITNGV